MYLRQSTASQEILLGRFVDAADGDTEMTGLTISNTDIKLHKAGATTLADKNSGGATHIANGLYYAVLDATDTNTLGNLEVHVHEATALAVKREYTVLPAAIYDCLIGDVVIPDATPAVGTRPKVLEALLWAVRALGAKDSAGSVLTYRKEDNTTAAATFSQDHPTDPTAITRLT